MEANELRIGNYTEQGKILAMKLEGIVVGFHYEAENHPDGYTEDAKAKLVENIISFNDAKPITLTKEILLLNGYKLFINGFVVDRFRFNFLDAYKYWYVTDLETKCYITKIEYVHEFQNFIRFVNGVELDIKL